MKKKIPTFKTDKDAEDFVDTADLSEYDLSGLRPLSSYFEFLPKTKNINLRVPEQLLEAVRERAKTRGMSYQKYIRQVLEDSLNTRT